MNTVKTWRQRRMNMMQPLVMASVLFASAEVVAQTIQVSTTQELRDAIAQANAGDRIELQDGVYRLDQKININRPGTTDAPIVIEAANLHQAILEVNVVEGINWSAANWTMEGLHFKGVCATPGNCEHALHITADADNIVIRHNVFEDFNAQIKGNGIKQDDGSFLMPDDVLIEANEFFDNTVRPTGNPVTKIDIVGGNRWIIRGNFIHDFAKGEGNKISYAAFLKGKSTQGVFERNLVVCEALHTGQIRLGLSFGGGGTGDQFCPDNTCTPEHSDGVMRNNIIAKCPTDVGIYLNESANTLIEHNTLFDNTGIDVRFESSSATLRNNLMSGRIRERNGGTITLQEGNITQLSSQDFAGLFTNPSALDFSLVDGSSFVDSGITPSSSSLDYCGQSRDGLPDVGAIEYLTANPCDTSVLPPFIEEDMSEGGEDMGSGGEEDMGQPVDDMGSGTGEDMGQPVGEDMGMAASDMGSTPDQGTSTPGTHDDADMVTMDSDMDSPDTGATEDEGCSVAHAPTHQSPSKSPLMWLAALVGLVGLARRKHP